MADTSVGAGVGASWNQQGFKLINNNWEHQGITDQTQYEVNDITTYSDSLYQCILQSDASVDSSRIPTNASYWKKIGGTGVSGRGIKSFSQTGNTITITLTDDTTFSFTLVQTNDVVAGDSAYVDAAVAKANTALQTVPVEYLTKTEGDVKYIAKTSSGNFATAAQGTKADTALQTIPSEYLTETEGDVRYITESQADSDFATIAQGKLADTSIQPGDIIVSADQKTLEIDGKVFDPPSADSVEVVGDLLYLKEDTTVISQTNLGLPTKTSDITNDSGYITKTQGDNSYIADSDRSSFATDAQGTKADEALPKSGGTLTGAVGTNSTFDGRDVATDGTKLDTIETDADVTDTTNVSGAGALMDSEVTNLAEVKAFDSSDYATAAQGENADSALQSFTEANNVVAGESTYVDNIKGNADSALQQSDISVSGTTLIIGTTSFDPQAATGTAESVVAWLKNSGSKVFNYVDGELSSFTITATDDSIWTQALNFTAGNLTSITYTHDSGNVATWEDTVITKTFNYTGENLTSIDYERS